MVQQKWSQERILKTSSGMQHGLVKEGQIRSGYTFKINYEKEFMNLDSIKKGIIFHLIFFFMLISIEDMLVKE